MGFRENLKSQLEYSGILVKELASRTGVKKKTIDSYLGNRAYKPSVDNAVIIARTLGVSVEYLVTGTEIAKERPISSLPIEVQETAFVSEKLNTRDRNIILNLARFLKSK